MKKIGRGWWFIIVVLPVSWIIQYLLFSGALPKVETGLYMFVPMVVAFLFFLFSKQTVKSQTSLFTRRTGFWPWIFAIGYPVLWLGIVTIIAILTGLGEFDPDFASQIFTPVFLLFFLMMLGSMLISVFGEEYGWRGYLLPALTEKHGRLWGTFILGLVWGIWHIPSYLFLYSEAGLGNPIFLTAVGVINVAVGAFAYSYLFYLNGNLLPSVLMHAMYNVLGQSLLFGAKKNPGISDAVPGLITIHWPHTMGLIITTGMVAAVVFTCIFTRSKKTDMASRM
ncbi:CPBP family intramembrane glutamic endopeptidase [Candidatus Contubernalis alkaliaceticus]|uniref:CPBP family intramembrane glutamic endopeptidase n=1 Tax=Candidatus Contubernalis alkaliaceticus TaxID=338645 RepID=UPI001F4C497B|nr:CPBP family intramembrane glutamic endopeptidase [Candidatus Contubernalis alkalaceticus]UNC91256.1 CPBP family intramembrane metalloprotease [Candidatus Contubernalis alkalaceticus]